MLDNERHLDLGSRVVVIVTFGLFVAAIFFKGLGHDLLLEAGVFLVSVKLIMMAYKNSVVASRLNDRLDDLHATLTRMASAVESARPPGLPEGPPNEALRSTGAAPRPEESQGGDRARG